MEQNISSTSSPTVSLCPVCHQPILPTYYFCPNCGTNLNTQPLSTSIGKQIGIYAFSIILPSILFLFITRWPGLKYFRSSDPKAKKIGEAASILLILSTIITFWLGYVWTQQMIQSTINSVNVDLSSYGL